MKFIVVTTTTEIRRVEVGAPDAQAALEIAADEEGQQVQVTVSTVVTPIAHPSEWAR